MVDFYVHVQIYNICYNNWSHDKTHVINVQLYIWMKIKMFYLHFVRGLL